MINTNKPRAILFDWDGTLAETSKLILNAYNHVFSHFNMPLWTEEDAQKNIRGSAREAFPKIFGEKTEEALKIHLAFVEENHLTTLYAMQDAERLLDLLKEKNITIGVVSNKRDHILKKEISHLTWNHFFDVTVGAGVAARDKPAPDSILYALDILNIKSGPDIWYVGDTDTDMIAAKAAQCAPVFIEHGYCTAAQVGVHNPVIVAKNCGHLLEICQKIL